jgi:hypothetical protein
MHDVISDILANPAVPRNRKRAAIIEAAGRYRDDTSYVTTRDEWLQMAAAMGVQNMGGPVRGFLAAFPTPTVERGAVMTHEAMDHSAMGHGAPAATAKPEPPPKSKVKPKPKPKPKPKQKPKQKPPADPHAGMDHGKKK